MISVFIFFLLTLLTRLYCIDTDSGGRAFLLSVLAKSLVLLLFLLAGLLGSLSLVLRSQCFELLGFGPRPLHFKVFYRVVLSASPSGVGSVAAQILLVHHFNVGGGAASSLRSRH